MNIASRRDVVLKSWGFALPLTKADWQLQTESLYKWLLQTEWSHLVLQLECPSSGKSDHKGLSVATIVQQPGLE